MSSEPSYTVSYADLKAMSGGALAPACVLARVGNSVIGVFALCLGLAVLVRYNGLFPSVIDWDVSLYAVMAQHWLQGDLPYEAVWDQHSVGLPALFAAILYVFPKSMVALRLSACVAVAATTTTVYVAARRIDRGWVAPLAAVVLYTAWTARLWGLSGNTEIYLNALIAPAMYMLMCQSEAPPGGTRSIARLCLAALLLGVAFQVKHVALATTALFFGAMLAATLRNGRTYAARALAAAAGCFLLPSLVVTAYFCAEGLAAQYFHAVVVANLVYVTDRPGVADILAHLPRSFIIPIGAIVAAAGIAWKRPDRRVAFVLAWAVAALIDVALPGKFWPHYFLLIMPPAALLAGLAAAAAYRAWGRSFALAVPVLVLLACNPVGVYADSMLTRALGHRDVPEIIAGVIGEDLSPKDSIFVFNYQPVLYFLTGARLPTRHVLPADWAQRYSAVTGVDPLEELDKVFRARPEYVVFLDNDWIRMGNGVLASLHRHLAGYEKRFEIMDEQILPKPVMVEVYRRRSDTHILKTP